MVALKISYAHVAAQLVARCRAPVPTAAGERQEQAPAGRPSGTFGWRPPAREGATLHGRALHAAVAAGARCASRLPERRPQPAGRPEGLLSEAVAGAMAGDSPLLEQLGAVARALNGGA